MKTLLLRRVPAGHTLSNKTNCMFYPIHRLFKSYWGEGDVNKCLAFVTNAVHYKGHFHNARSVFLFGFLGNPVRVMQRFYYNAPTLVRVEFHPLEEHYLVIECDISYQSFMCYVLCAYYGKSFYQAPICKRKSAHWMQLEKITTNQSSHYVGHSQDIYDDRATSSRWLQIS